MSDQDLIQLYSKRILSLAAEIPLTALLPDADGVAKKRSPLCGSTITVSVKLDAGRVAAFGQDVKACALGQASASVLGSAVIGRTRDEIAAGREALRAMLKDGADAPSGHFADLEVLAPARDYKNRHASIMLAWDATLDAMDQAAARQVG